MNNTMEEGKTEKTASPPEQKKRGFRIWPAVIWAIIGVIAFILAIQIAVADKYQAQVKVIEGEKKVGVNPTTEKLDFGDLAPDTTAVRYVSLSAGGVNTYIRVFMFGSIAELVELSDNQFTMERGDEKKLEFSLYMPPSAPVGQEFTGRVWVFKVPKFW